MSDLPLGKDSLIGQSLSRNNNNNGKIRPSARWKLACCIALSCH